MAGWILRQHSVTVQALCRSCASHATPAMKCAPSSGSGRVLGGPCSATSTWVRWHGSPGATVQHLGFACNSRTKGFKAFIQAQRELHSRKKSAYLQDAHPLAHTHRVNHCACWHALWGGADQCTRLCQLLHTRVHDNLRYYISLTHMYARVHVQAATVLQCASLAAARWRVGARAMEAKGARGSH